MSTAKQIEAILSDSNWDPRIITLCEDCGITAPETIQGIQKFAVEKLEQLHGIVTDVMIEGDDDETDLRAALIYWYVEAKAQWSYQNQRINYQTMTTGCPDPVLMVMGALGTSILAELERVLPSSETEALNDFLSSPLENSVQLNELRDLQLNEGHCELPLTLTSDIQKTLINVLEYQFKLETKRTQTESDEVFREFEEIVEKAQEHLIHLNSMDPYEKFLRKQVQSISLECQLRILPKFSFDRNVPIDTRIQDLILSVTESWLADLKKLGFEPNSIVRVASGKAGFIEIKFRLTTLEDQILFTIEDDGKGLGVEGEAVETACDLGYQTPRLGKIQTFKRSMVAIESYGNRGSKLSLFVPKPRTLRATDYIIVGIGSETYAIDFDSIESVVGFDKSNLKNKDTVPSIILHDERLQVVALGNTLGRDHSLPLFGVGLKIANIAYPILAVVDRVISRQRSVARPLDHALLDLQPWITGFLLDGEICRLVIDVPKLLFPSRSGSTEQDLTQEAHAA